MSAAGGSGIGSHVGHHHGRRCVLGSCLEDLPDDLEARPFQLAFAPQYLPPGVDLRRWMSPVEDAGLLGTSSAAALAGALEYLVLRSTRRHVDVSRLFIYYHQRLLHDQVRQDVGGSLRDGVRVLTRLGVPLEAAWPYTLDLFAVQPPEPVHRAAQRHRIVDFTQVPLDAAALRGCLAGGIPVAIGLWIAASFLEVGPDGRVPRPSPQERPEGRHALLLVGYSDPHGCFIARNTWGADWGAAGYCYLSYDYVLDPALAQPGWALRTSTDLAFEPGEHAVAVGAAVAPGAGAVASGPVAAPAAAGLGGAPLPGREQPSSQPGLLRSLGAVALGRKSPMDLAVDLAARHGGGLVARFTGSQMAGQVVGGVMRQLAPALRAGTPVTLDAVGGALVGAAIGAPAPPGAPVGAAAAGPAVDPGVLMDVDRSAQLLAALRSPPAPVAVTRLHWDDTYDEEAALLGPLAAQLAGASPPAATPAAPRPGAGVAAASTAGAAGPGAQGIPAAASVLDPASQALLDAWRAAGGAASALGSLTSAALALPDGVGRGALCERGALVWHPSRGAVPLLGSLYHTWSRTGAERGPLGYPVRAERTVTEGAWRARLQRFDGGLLVDWDHATAEDLPPFAVLGGDALYQAWLAAGAEEGPAGVPVGVPQEIVPNAARLLPCSDGGVVWTFSHGTAVLDRERYRRWCATLQGC